MTVLASLPDVTPLLLGMDWMEPEYLLDRFGPELLWASLVIIFIECGLFFPFLPGDTLLLSLGVFIATDDIDIFPGGQGAEMSLALALLIVAAMLGNIAGYEIGRAIGPPLYHREGRILKKSTSTRPGSSSRSTATRPWSSAGSCRSCAPTSPSWRGSPGWSAAGSCCGASSAPSSGS